MRLYLDDDSVSGVLVHLLQRAGHDVQVPRDVGLDGADDPIHLGHAVKDDRTCLSHNHRDFKNLHNLILIVGGHYPGLLVVRKDNDPKRDLDAKGIVRALAKLLGTGIPLVDHLHILNHWR